MSQKAALLFPGQGSQKVGMGLDVYESSTKAKAIFEEANSILGVDLTRIILEGPADVLTSTAYCQPAILTVSVANLEAFKETEEYQSLDIQYCAGLSLGEYSALVAAGMLNFADAMRLVQSRANLMEDAASKTSGAMSAIIGFDQKKLKEICQATGAEIANFNTPEQIVITGHADRVKAAGEQITAAGGRVMPLEVSGAFHSSLMKPAEIGFVDVLNNVTVSPSDIQVISNVTGLPHQSTGIKENLAKQITSSVQWVDSIQYLMAQGVEVFQDIGPGKVISGLVRKIRSM